MRGPFLLGDDADMDKIHRNIIKSSVFPLQLNGENPDLRKTFGLLKYLHGYDSNVDFQVLCSQM